MKSGRSKDLPDFKIKTYFERKMQNENELLTTRHNIVII